MVELSYDEQGEAYADDAQVATVVWLQYDGDDPELEDHYLLMDRDKELGRGLAALGGKVEEQDFHEVELPEDISYDNPGLDQAAARNAHREAQEEADVDSIYDMEHIGRVTQVSREEGSFDEPWIIYHFTARTDEEPDSYEHREGELDWYHEDELPEQDYTLMHGEFVDNVREEEPFTAIVDDAHDVYHTFSPEYTPVNKVDGIRDWPEDVLEQDLVQAPEDLVDLLLGETDDG